VESPLPPVEHPWLHLEQAESLQILIAAIRRLPDKRQQRIILLKFFAGLSDKEIAVRLDLTPNNVRVTRFRALIRLREDNDLKNYFKQ
jgi:RNA polymerase sigma factor (sigma-70 family)